MMCWRGSGIAVAPLLLLLVLMSASCGAVDCGSRNKDYCEVKRACVWDEQQGNCRKLDCRDYHDHASCVADPKDLGPCSFEWKLHVCYQKDGKVPCTAYLEDCPSERCQYDKDRGFCYGLDEQLPCFYLHDEEQCKKASGRCTYKNEACISTAEANSCSSHFKPDECTGDCKFHQDAGICFPKDLTIPCKLFHTNDSCDESRCTRYPTGSQGIVCVDKGEQPPCDAFFGSSACPDQRCQWNDGAQRCYNPKVGLDCQFYFDTELCPQDKCRVIGGLCMDKEQPVDCSVFYYGDDDCSKANGCRPDCDQAMCVACPASGECDDSRCPDITPAPAFNCTQYTAEGDCRSDPACKWDEEVKACVDGDVGTPCSDYLVPRQCNGARDCAWDMGECIACKNGDCKHVTTTTAPDTGKPCSTYGQDACPFPRCIFSYDDNVDGECHKSQCKDFVDEDTCKAHDGCSFDKNVYACYQTSEGPPCNFYGDKGLCNQLANCKWDDDNYYCAGKDTGKSCSKYSVNNCPSRCIARYDTNQCEAPGCADIHDKGPCEKAGCTYDEDMYICYNDTGKACGKYKSYNTCPPNRCSFRPNDAHPNGVCTKKICKELYDKEECLAVKGCKFVDSVNLCYSDSGKPCNKYTDYDNCPANRCTWADTTDGKHQCEKRVCPEFVDQGLCTGAGCEWDKIAHTCFNDTHLSCDKYTERTCPTTRCVYDYNFGLCRTLDCPDFSDPQRCDSSGKGCVFNTTYGVCVEKGEPIPCSVFNFNPNDCPTNYCKYAKDVDVCYAKDGEVPCSYIYAQSPCDKRNHCTWNTNMYRCEGTPVHSRKTGFLTSIN